MSAADVAKNAATIADAERMTLAGLQAAYRQLKDTT
jgi:hypothetical protein